MLYTVLVLCVSAAVGSAVPGKVARPCKLTDLKCIGDNLAANSRCDKRVAGGLPAELRMGRFRFDTPYFNSTYEEKGLIIRNINRCYVSEFFFNVATDVAVLALDCPLLEFQAERTILQHYPLEEDSRFTYNYHGIYPLIRLTTNIPNANKMDVCSANTHADVTALPFFKVDPKDQNTANFLTRDLTLLNIYEIETFHTRGRYIFRDFINAYICNFGCTYQYQEGYF